MNFKNKIFIFTLLSLLICAMGIVSASSDDNNLTVADEQVMELDDACNMIQSVDNVSSKEVLQSNEDDFIVVEDWNELQYYCSQTDKNYNLKLKENTNYYPDNPGDSNYQIRIKNKVKIVGANGSYIGDVSPNARGVDYSLFVVESKARVAAMHIENITFKWIEPRKNYAIHKIIQMDVRDKYTNVLKNCIFDNIGSTQNMYDYLVTMGNGNAILDNCSFINCWSTEGLIRVSDSKMNKTTHMILQNCYFSGNHAAIAPGCVYNSGKLTVINSSFIGNGAGYWAGAVHTAGYGNTTIIDSYFKDNIAGWNGGALYTYADLQIYNTTFINNHCTTNNGGGAIGACKYVSAPHIYIEGCLFKENKNNCWSLDSLSTTGTGRGGAISFMDGGSIEVRDTSFIANSASIGTAICAWAFAGYGSPNVFIVNNSFINHTRAGDTLNVKTSGTPAVISDNYFSGNSIEFSKLELTKLIEDKEQATLQITASLSNPSYYDSDILDKTLYDVYINNKFIKTVNSTVFTIDFGDLDICDVYVIPTISNRKSNEVTVTSTREYVFVSKNNGNDTNNGISRDNPVNTIKRALELATVRKNIILLDGNYSEENIVIDYDVTIKGEGNATLINETSFIANSDFSLRNMKISNLTVESFIRGSGELTIFNCIFDNNTASQLIESQHADISKSIFTNNDAVILYNNGVASIHDSILLNNSDIVQGSLNNLNLDYNWWGSTLPNFNIKNYLTLNLTGSANALEVNQKANVGFGFYLNGLTEYNGLPEIDLTINTVNGSSSENEVNINDNVVFTLTALGDGILYAGYKGEVSDFSFKFLKSNPNIKAETYDVMSGSNVVVTVTAPSDRECNLTVQIDNVTQKKTVKSKSTVFTFSNVRAGNHIIYVDYGGDEKYISQSITSHVKVSKYESKTNIDIGDVEVGKDVILTISVSDSSTGNITLSINNNTQTLTLNNSKANYTIKNIPRGDYHIAAAYNGDEKYLASSDSKLIEVDNLEPSVEVTIKPITYGEDLVVDVKVDDGATGFVKVTTDGISNSSKITNSNAKVILTKINAGINKNITVFYGGDNNYFNKTVLSSYSIYKADLDFQVSCSDIMIGDSQVISITVPAKTAGTFTVNGTQLNIPLTGEVEYVIDDLAVGNYTLTVTYNGNNYKTLSKNIDFSVFEYDSPQWANPGQNTENTQKSPHESVTNGEFAFSIPISEDITGDIVIDSMGNIYITTQSGIYSFNGMANMRWHFTSTDVEGNFSGVAISRDVVVAPKAGDTLYFINQTTGEKYESNIYQGSSAFAPIIDSNANVYTVSEFQSDQMGKNDGYNLVITPFNIWKTGGSPITVYLGKYEPVCSASANENIITVLSYDSSKNKNILRIIDAKTLDYSSKYDFSSVRPVIGENNIIYAILGDYVVAQDKNFKVTWMSEVTGGVGNHLALDNERGLYHVNAKGILYRYDLISGDESKMSDLKLTSGILIGSDGNLYFGCDKTFYALDSDGNVLWKSYIGSRITGNPVMDKDGLIYVTTEDNKVIALTYAPLKDSNLKVEVEDIVEGETATVTITWNNQTTGTITFNINGEEVTVNAENAKFTKAISGLDIGYYDVDVSYSGDMRFKPAGITKTIVVRAVNDIANNIKFDGNRTFTFTLNNAKGNLTVNIAGKSYSKALVKGKASIKVNDLDPGEWEALVTYSGDGVFDKANRTFTVSVPKLEVQLNETISMENVDFAVSVSLPDDASGNLTLSFGTRKYTQKITDGKAAIVVDDMDAGNYTPTLAYSGDNKYESASKTLSINTTRIPVTLGETNVFVKSGVQPVISIKLDSGTTGRFVVNVDNEKYGADIRENITISNLEPGNYTGTVTYGGDRKYDEASCVISFEVLNATVIDNSTNGTVIDNSTNTTVKLDPDLVVSAGDVNVGEDALINVETSVESGKLTVNVGNENYELIINDGKASKTIPDLDAGKYDVMVWFAGDDKYNSASNSTSFKVTVPLTDEAITIPEGNSSAYSISLPSDATGTLTVTVDGTSYTSQLVKGKATVNVPELGEGTHDITIAYSGDDKYETIVKSIVVNVNKTDDNTTNATGDNSTVIDNSTNTTVEKVDPMLIVNAGDVNVGDNAVVNVKTSVESGKLIVNVNNKDYECIINNGESGLTIPDLAVGNYTVTVKFAGDDRFNEASNSTSFNVIKVNVPVTDETITIPDGDSTSYSVNLPADATGTLIVTVDGKDYTSQLVNGKATVNVPELGEGTHNITIIYSGDDKYEKIVKSSVVNVNRTADNVTNATGDNATAVDNSTNTTVKADATLIVDAADITVGDDAVVNVKTSVESGKVTVNVSGKDYELIVTNGKASVTISDLAVGTYEVVASFAGDGLFNKASNSTSFNVLKVSVPISDETVTIPSGASSTYSVSLPGDATGTLTVTVDGVNYTSQLVNGKATVNIPQLKTGTHNITVTYSGDAKYSPIVKSSVVTKAPTIKLTGSKLTMLYTSGKYFKVRLTSDGVPVAGQKVKIKINGKTYTRTTNKNGYASLKISLPPKTYTAKATYGNLSITKKVVVKTVIKANNINAKKSAKQVKIKVTLKKVNKKYLKNKKVTLKFNKKTYKLKTNKKGVVTFTIKKNVYSKLKVNKKYTYQVIYAKDKVKKTIKFKK